MREEYSDWFSKWEEELPSPEELIPLSQSLITPHLAVAFDLQPPNHRNTGHQPPQPPANSTAGDDEPAARTLKRPRLVWTPQLHKRFVDAVAHLGIKNAVPKTIMQLMSVDGLTRENVASHLQKYRLYLNRTNSGGGGGGGGNFGGSDHLFSSSHFINPTGRQSSDLFLNSSSFVSIPTLHHRQPLRHAANFTSPASNNKFLTRQSQFQQEQVLRTNHHTEDLESRTKKMLTLFPTRED